MGKLLIKDKEIVVPGQILAEGMDYLPSGGAFREDNNIIASQVGVINLNGRLIKLIPLTGRYVPKKGDTIIGRVTDMTYSGWFVDIGYANDAMLSMKEASTDFIARDADLSRYFKIGDHMAAKIIKVTKSKQIDLTAKGPGLRRVQGGIIIKITPVKVPRVIGKAGSMISMIKEKTDCRITVGQNGVVWISGANPDKEKKAVDAINLIDSESHESGLTDKIKEFLDNEKKIIKNIEDKKPVKKTSDAVADLQSAKLKKREYKETKVSVPIKQVIDGKVKKNVQKKR